MHNSFLPTRTANEWLRTLLPAIALLALLIPTYYNVAIGLWKYEENAFAPLLAMAAFLLICYRIRKVHLLAGQGVPLLGIILLAIGIIGYVVGRSQKIELIELLAGIPLMAGTLEITGGRAALKQMRFPLFFLLFSVPYPSWVIFSLTNPLKTWISSWAEFVLYAAGYPVARSGVVLDLGPYRMLVADACSGMHSLLFLSAMGLLYIHLTGLRARWHCFLLVATLLPIAVLANFVRVMTLVLTTYHFGDAAGQGFWHDLAGLLLFVTAFAGLFGLDNLLMLIGRRYWKHGQQDAYPQSAVSSQPTVQIVSWPNSMLLTTLLLLTAVVAMTLTPHRLMANGKAVPELESLIPQQFGDWRHDELTDTLLVAPEQKANLPRYYSQMLLRTYIGSEGQRIMLSISYGNNQMGQAFQAHRPESCYRAQGFTLIDSREAGLSLRNQTLKVRRLVAQHNTRIEPITYWMTIGDKPTLPGIPRKIEQLRHGLRGEIPDGMLIRVSTIGRDFEKAFMLHARFISDLQQAVPGTIGFGLSP